ncbi:MAG: endo-1,4-beta-xylanase [Spirochaetaceae bacterium]
MSDGGEEWGALDAGGAHSLSVAGADVLAGTDERIKRYRQSDVELLFIDSEGNPVPGLRVDVQQSSHDFVFGDQTGPLDSMIRSGGGDSDRAQFWKRRFSECLNSATALCYWTERAEHDMSKTEDQQGDLRVSHMRKVVEWASSEGLHVKGHPLFWSIPKCWPSWLMRYDTDTQMKFAEVRVRSLLAAFGRKVRTWDLVNEALWEPAPQNLATREWPHLEPVDVIAEYVGRVLDWCRDEVPENTYVLNDYGMEQDGPKAPVAANGIAVTAEFQRRRMLDILGKLDRTGCMPDALGLQSHTGGRMDPAEQMSLYDELAVAGIPLHITEFWARRSLFEQEGDTADVPIKKSGSRYLNRTDPVEERRADYITRFLRVAFSHPAVEAFSFWGFMSDSIDWSERSAAHSPGPVYRAVQKLLNEEWRTSEELRSDEQGRVQFRGFHGEYRVRLLHERNSDRAPAERFRVSSATENRIRIPVRGRRLSVEPG